jgi:hypothetical protein
MAEPGVGFSFRPEFAGEFSSDRAIPDFLARVERRVNGGLLVPGVRARANYRVCASSPDAIEFKAVGFFTAWNIGLNHVRLERTGPTTYCFNVRFNRWTLYCVIHGALLATALVVVYALSPALRATVASGPGRAPLFWGMIGFWGFAWPWLLTALHRPFARQALERILREESERGGETRSAA